MERQYIMAVKIYTWDLQLDHKQPQLALVKLHQYKAQEVQIDNIKTEYEHFKESYKEKKEKTIALKNNITSEKILDGFAADTIPIYFGNKLITKEFYSDSFINLHDFPTFEDAIERIIEVDQNNELYLHKLDFYPFYLLTIFVLVDNLIYKIPKHY
jgi:hypothetical protein